MLENFSRRSDSEVFCENSTYANRTHLKSRLYKMGVEEKCAICGINPEWNGRPLVLQLDHINGVGNDNRIENLQILCPNCHSQTETFSGRGRKEKKKYFCECGAEIWKKSKSCRPCAVKKRGK